MTDLAHMAPPAFGAYERRLKLMSAALWRLHPVCRAVIEKEGVPPQRRTSFDGSFIRIPDRIGGGEVFRAAIAHVDAHLAYGGAKFPLGQLKPLQVALVSLIEDARVEALAIRDFPGLRALWVAQHVAEPGGATAEALLARLARALIDPSYADDNPWIAKGRAMVAEAGPDDPADSRRIGGLLANDLGQMRLQFNAKTYVVEPAYRDDNLGLWDFGETPPEMEEEAEIVLGAFRRREQAEEEVPQQQRREQDDESGSIVARAREIDPDAGIPIARYPEWDHGRGMALADWVTVLEFEPRRVPPVSLDRLLAGYADLQHRIERLMRAARISRPTRLRRQAEGDRLDLEACLRAAIERRAGLTPDPRVYETSALRDRDLAVLLLLDMSESTRDFVKGSSTTILAVEKAATAVLAEAMAALGDNFAIQGFCSNGRDEMRCYPVKAFNQPYDQAAHERLAGLQSGLSTRMGAALRHAGAEIEPIAAYRRLILVLSDGEPSDIDVEDKAYLVEDARRAVHELGRRGIDVFCVGLDSSGTNYLGRIFGRRNAVSISRLDSLPRKLPALYFRLTA